MSFMTIGQKCERAIGCFVLVILSYLALLIILSNILKIYIYKVCPSNNLLILPASMIWVYHQHAMPPEISLTMHAKTISPKLRVTFATSV